MKSYHDPRPVCALPFRLSGPAYSCRLRRTNRTAGRMVPKKRPLSREEFEKLLKSIPTKEFQEMLNASVVRMAKRLSGRDEEE